MISKIPIIQQGIQFSKRTAIIDERGTYSYERLLHDGYQVATSLLGYDIPIHEKPIAFLIPSSYEYVKVQWGIWLSGGIAVPLAVNHPLAELEYVIQDTGTSFLMYHPIFEEKAKSLAEKFSIQIINIDSIKNVNTQHIVFPEVMPEQKAMMVYTSGTTGKPKGVITSHNNITAHIQALTQAWHWSKEDRIVNILPLHHVHGIVNIVASSLWNGATCYMLPKFDMDRVWELILKKELTVFMAVPTIYSKMIESFNTFSEAKKEAIKESCRTMRLMVSGSAALPVRVLNEWEEISGHVLLSG